jgi:hypothetical protein
MTTIMKVNQTKGVPPNCMGRAATTCDWALDCVNLDACGDGGAAAGTGGAATCTMTGVGATTSTSGAGGAGSGSGGSAGTGGSVDQPKG